MREVVHNILWAALVIALIAYASFLFFGSIFASAAENSLKTVLVRDTLMGDGSHRLSGMVMVASACDEISSTPKKVAEGEYQLLFNTWREPYTDCTSELTPRAFHIILFVNNHAHYTAVLDGVSLPTVVLSSVATN